MLSFDRWIFDRKFEDSKGLEKYYWQYKFSNGTGTIRFQMIEILSRLNFAGIVGGGKKGINY